MSKTNVMEGFHDLFEKKSFAHLATIMPDGSPQVTPVWIDYDGEYLLVNSAKGRQKDRNMRSNPQVALSIQDPDDPYRYLQVRGFVDEITTEGAEEHIDGRAKHYLGLDEYPHRSEDEIRVIYKIKPQAV